MGMSAAQIKPLSKRLGEIFMKNTKRDTPDPEFSQLVRTIRDEGYSDDIIVAIIWNQDQEDGRVRQLSRSQHHWNDLLDMIDQV